MERVGARGRPGYRWKALGELFRSPSRPTEVHFIQNFESRACARCTPPLFDTPATLQPHGSPWAMRAAGDAPAPQLSAAAHVRRPRRDIAASSTAHLVHHHLYNQAFAQIFAAAPRSVVNTSVWDTAGGTDAHVHVRRCLARAGGRTARDHRPPSARPPITSSPTPLTSTLLLRCATLPTLHCCCCRAVRHSSCCSRSACCSRAARTARAAGTARSRSPTRPPCTPSHSSSSSSRGHGMSRLLASDGHERAAGGARGRSPPPSPPAALATFAAAASTATSLSPPQTRLR